MLRVHESPDGGIAPSSASVACPVKAIVSPTAQVSEAAGVSMTGTGATLLAFTRSSSVLLSPFELSTWRVIGYTAGAPMDHLTTSPLLSAAPVKAPSWSRSQRHATRCSPGSASTEAEASRVTTTGALDTAGVTVARATGSSAYRTRMTWLPWRSA